MTTIDRCPLLDAAASLEQAAALVTQGTALFSPEHLAGQYAFVAAQQAGYGLDTDAMEANLGILSGAGAEFEARAALASALKFAEQA